MRATICGTVLRRGAMTAMMMLLVLCGTAAIAQQPASPKTGIATDLALTYTLERTQTVGTGCGCFWLNGGSADAAFTFYRGIGLALNLTGEHAANITPGVNFGKLSYMAGPRYTFTPLRKTKRTRAFAEALFGGVHGFDAFFPGNGGATNTANAFSMQLGGGVDLGLGKGFSVRALEIGYVHTTLPNDALNSQNDLRLAFGVSYHLGRR